MHLEWSSNQAKVKLIICTYNDHLDGSERLGIVKPTNNSMTPVPVKVYSFHVYFSIER
jgi:hypothetical protein